MSAQIFTPLKSILTTSIYMAAIKLSLCNQVSMLLASPDAFRTLFNYSLQNLLKLCPVCEGIQHEQPFSSQATQTLLGLGWGFDSATPEHSACFQTIFLCSCVCILQTIVLLENKSPKLYFFLFFRQDHIVLQDFPILQLSFEPLSLQAFWFWLLWSILIAWCCHLCPFYALWCGWWICGIMICCLFANLVRPPNFILLYDGFPYVIWQTVWDFIQLSFS